MNEIKRVGIVAMPKISVAGGFARVTRDLIANLNAVGKEVYLATPFRVDMEKIKELYGEIRIDKFFYSAKLKDIFSREETLGRRLLIRQFKKMAKEVDFIIDLDGGVFHNYLPKGFNKENYIVWRLSCINPDTHKLQNFTSWRILAKKFMKNIALREKDLPKQSKIYPVDEWTKREIKEFWKIEPQETCLYPEIKVDEFNPKEKKDDQIIIMGRIAPNKEIHSSVRIFNEATKDHPEYKLLIIGGKTPDTDRYLVELNQLIDELKIKDRVNIVADAPFSEIKKALSKSKVIIDSQIGTSLNMPIIESMASGCVPIMRKNSGTFTEVLDNGKYGYGFENIEEGVRILAKLLEEKSIDINKVVERSKFFSSANFRKRLNKILNKEV